MKININKLLDVYGLSEDNWGDLPYFQGGYINYGYWKNINIKDHISIEQRIQSSINLYQEVISRLDLAGDSVVLEIGCGRGIGIANVLAYTPHKQIYALDINPDQISRANINIQRIVDKDLPLVFVNNNIEHTELPDASIDKAYSVEVAQHFNSIKQFAKEMRRILKSNGKLVFATYFPTKHASKNKLNELLPLILEGLENTSVADEICNLFINAGFNEATYESIGDDVFLGYYSWLKQVGSNFWSLNYYKAYKDGLIDYYIFTIR